MVSRRRAALVCGICDKFPGNKDYRSSRGDYCRHWLDGGGAKSYFLLHIYIESEHIHVVMCARTTHTDAAATPSIC